MIIQPCLLISFIRSKIFDRVVANQPGKPGDQCGHEPFYDCDHNELLNCIKNYRNDSIMTESKEKGTQKILQSREQF